MVKEILFVYANLKGQIYFNGWFMNIYIDRKEKGV